MNESVWSFQPASGGETGLFLCGWRSVRGSQPGSGEAEWPQCARRQIRGLGQQSKHLHPSRLRRQ